MFKKLVRVVTLAKRFVRVFILKPSATGKFLDVATLPVCAKLVSKAVTAFEPKQVVFHRKSCQLLVSCMKGQVVQAFTLQNNGEFSLEREWRFPLQCVEVSVSGNLCFVSMTNFKRFGEEESRLAIIDLVSNEVVSTVATGGEWSKVVKKHPTRDLVFVSNWHSHDVSVIDISNLQEPKVVGLVKCGESPRGISFTPEGLCLVTGFYSARIYVLGQGGDGLWKLVSQSPRVLRGGYPGNLRDILVDPKRRCAYVSNLGRNELYVFDFPTNTFVNSTLVGKQPNALCFIDGGGKTLLVSCRADDTILFVDTQSLKVIGRSPTTATLPTGLEAVGEGFVVTCFRNNSIEYYEYSK